MYLRALDASVWLCAVAPSGNNLHRPTRPFNVKHATAAHNVRLATFPALLHRQKRRVRRVFYPHASKCMRRHLDKTWVLFLLERTELVCRSSFWVLELLGVDFLCFVGSVEKRFVLGFGTGIDSWLPFEYFLRTNSMTMFVKRGTRWSQGFKPLSYWLVRNWLSPMDSKNRVCSLEADKGFYTI